MCGLHLKNDRAPSDTKITSIEANDEDNTITINTSEPTPALINYLCDPYGAIIDMQAGITSDKNVSGTGSYKATAVSDTEITLEKNENYWDGEPKMDTVVVRSITDGDTLTSALQSGEIDASYGLPYASYELFGDKNNYTINDCSTSRAFFGQVNYEKTTRLLCLCRTILRRFVPLQITLSCLKTAKLWSRERQKMYSPLQEALTRKSFLLLFLLLLRRWNMMGLSSSFAVPKNTCCSSQRSEVQCAQTGISVLEAKNLCKVFERKGLTDVVAVDSVSFSVYAGECLGIVGESGSGKSTIVNMIARLIEPTSGSLVLNGEDITQARGKDLRRVYQSVQMVFQNPAESFDPRKTLGQSITEGMRNMRVGKAEAQKRAKELLELCQLPVSILGRYPREVSGGQCQRAAIARALVVKPSLLICDEATSALDVTVQRQIIDLLKRLRFELDMSLLFICHDLALVGGVCDRVLVMRSGKIVEQGSTKNVLFDPQTEYVKLLLSAML